MTDYLPDVYVDLRSRFPSVVTADDELVRDSDIARPMGTRTVQWGKLGMAVR